MHTFPSAVCVCVCVCVYVSVCTYHLSGMMLCAMDAAMRSSNSCTGLPAPRRECVPIMKASTNGCIRQQDSEEVGKCLKCAEHFRHTGAVCVYVRVGTLMNLWEKEWEAVVSILFFCHPCLLLLLLSLSVSLSLEKYIHMHWYVCLDMSSGMAHFVEV